MVFQITFWDPVAQHWPIDCLAGCQRLVCYLLLNLAGTCSKVFDNPSVLWASHVCIWKTGNSSHARWEGGRLEGAHYKDLPHNFHSRRSALKALYRRKLHFNTDDHVNIPQVLVTLEQKKQAGDCLWFMLRRKTDVKPPSWPRLAASLSHRTEEIPNKLFKALSHLSWIWGASWEENNFHGATVG